MGRVLLLLVVVACPGPEARGPYVDTAEPAYDGPPAHRDTAAEPDPNGVSWPAFVESFPRAWCRLYTSCIDPEMPEGQCVRAMEEWLAAYTCGYDEAVGQACLEELQAVTCAEAATWDMGSCAVFVDGC